MPAVPGALRSHLPQGRPRLRHLLLIPHTLGLPDPTYDDPFHTTTITFARFVWAIR